LAFSEISLSAEGSTSYPRLVPRVVVAKSSTRPDGLSRDYFAFDGAGLAALCDTLS